MLSFYKFESKRPQGRGSGGGSETYADKVTYKQVQLHNFPKIHFGADLD